jgi:predicted acylesterase/phospholipase RssA
MVTSFMNTQALTQALTKTLSQALVGALLLLAVGSSLGGCSQSLALNSVPSKIVDRAEVIGFSKIRAWGDSKPEDLQALTGKPAAADQRASLALSGGGSDGAYGAGILVGWTASGRRPEFAVVTGVSTGALAAPFAFLGPAYDAKLREVYTSYSTSDLGSPRVFSALLGGPSVADSGGLESLLTRYIDDRLLAAIADQHRRGRRLFVTTTNVEAERQVIWNLGAIAASGRNDSLRLFRRVVLASASIPGVFPPVLLDVTVDGRRYQEMHADGGTAGQVFFLPPAATHPGNDQRLLYVIRNGKLGPEWQASQGTTIAIAGRSLNTLIKAQARGDVERLQVMAERNRMGFRLAAIPDNFRQIAQEAFDRDYMRNLFELGYRQASTAYPWAAALP